MKFLTIIIAICLFVTMATGQYFFRPRRQFNSFNRDPRQNRGPVVFPPSPPDAIDESSGVIVGASGYGFVPPQQRNPIYYSTAAVPELPLETPATSFATLHFYDNPFISPIRYF